MVIQDVSWKGDDMKKMIAIVLLLISSQSQARWSRFAHVTPENESKYGLEVKLTPVDGQKSKFSIKVKAVADDAKNAWLIVASEALSKEGQELRYYIWQSKKTEKDILVKAMLMPTKGAGESSARRRPKYYEVELDSKLMGRSYIYIDFPSPVTDGGYYCSIDLGSYLKKMTKGSANKEPQAGDVPQADGVITNSIGMKLVYIPAGEFMMGSPSPHHSRDSDEGPQHKVKISKGFWMGVTEVTQSQYRAVMGTNPSNFKGDNNPVEMVTWNKATEFCKKLSQKDGKTYRLPTEAQWEYACRADTTTPFNTGQTISTDQANYNNDYVYATGSKGVYRKKTTEVGSFSANAFGLYDMHGNVWEWCSDWYGEDYYSNSSSVDPEGPSTGEKRVLRGGGWKNGPRYCRSANRLRRSPVSSYYDFGFRIVSLNFH